jgi:hypothetical protein
MSIALLLAVLAAIAEIAIWYSTALGHISILFALTLHLILSLVIAANVFTFRKKKRGAAFFECRDPLHGPIWCGRRGHHGTVRAPTR